MEASERRLAGILSADAVGYSRLMAEDEPATVRAVRAHHDAMRALVEERRGRVVDTPGDNLLAEFPSVVEAVRCALEIQRGVAERNRDLPEARRMQFRIGVHLGDVIAEGDRIYGDGVNIAARLEGLADPGGITLSREAVDQVRHRLDVVLDDLGEKTVKNVPHPLQVYRVRDGSTGEGAQPATNRRKSLPRAAPALAGVALLCAALFAGYRALRPESATTPDRATPIRSLVVLPLDNLSGDPEQEYFADGMTEAVIANLAQIGVLRVISRTSAMRYKHADKPLPEIAEELGVDAVIEGSVVRSGGRVRVTAQLIDARSDHHLWAESYEREVVDVLSLQGDVSGAIARAIELELTPRQSEPKAPVVPAAYEAYLRGRHLLASGGVHSHKRASEHFRRAIDLDPTWAPAWAGLADSLSCSCMWTLPSEGFPKARAAAEKALELDPGLAEGHSAVGLIQLLYDWDWTAAERNFTRALELNPGLTWTRTMYGILLLQLGRIDESRVQLERVREDDPLGTRLVLAHLYVLRGERAAAEEEFERELSVAPLESSTLRELGGYQCQNDRFDEGIATLTTAAWVTPHDPRNAAELAYCYAAAGRADEARAILADLERLAAERYVDAASIALVHVALGDRETAFEWLGRAYELRSMYLPRLLTDPRLAPLHPDPRFASLLERLDLPAG